MAMTTSVAVVMQKLSELNRRYAPIVLSSTDIGLIYITQKKEEQRAAAAAAGGTSGTTAGTSTAGKGKK